MSDVGRLVGAVDAVERILAVGIVEIKRPRAERIVRAARQPAHGDDRFQMRPALDHVGWRHPARPFGHAIDRGGSGPTIGPPAGPENIAHRVATRPKGLKQPFLRIDYYSAGRL